ncbi:GTP cyclohydrolase II [Tumebacillus lipolyticus]|uniref:GTP cyclohydrolase II n=1 Tax=Tumebacillus lipolyticus TaxID=1280370 RepID=A0ABW5A366_9BACL
MANQINHFSQLLKDHVQQLECGRTKLFLVGPVQLPITLEGETVTFQWYSWLSGENLPEDCGTLLKRLPSLQLENFQQSSVLVYGNFKSSSNAVIRMHSICHTGDIFGSKRCDCGSQLSKSLQQIIEFGSGALFYLANHEGRGIGLFSKAFTYLLQEQGLDTVEANLALGFPEDARTYEEALTVLQHLRKGQVTLLTNNPNKLNALRNAGLQETKMVSLWGDVTQYNQNYIKTKIKKSGHQMNEEQQSLLLQPAENR